MQQPVDPGHVRARFLPRPDSGNLAQLDLAWIEQNEFRAVGHRLADLKPDDRVVLGGIRSCYEDDIGIQEIIHRICHRPGTKRQRQPGNSGRVAQARAVVDIIRPHGGAHELLENVIVFVSNLGRRQPPECVTTVLLKFAGDEGQRLFPGCFAKAVGGSY